MATSSVIAARAAVAARARGGAEEEEKRQMGVVSSASCGRAFLFAPSQPQERTSFSLSYSEEGLPLIVPSCGAGNVSSFLCSSANGNLMSASMPRMVMSSPLGIPFPYAGTSGMGLPAGTGAASVCRWNPAAASFSRSKEGVSTGTTIVAVTFKDGVVLGADTRTSAGSYVVNRAARKITPIHEKICVCRSGSAADTQALTQIVKLYLQQYAQELPRRSPAAEKRKHEQRVAAAAAKQQREIEQQEKEQKKREAREEEQQSTKEEERGHREGRQEEDKKSSSSVGPAALEGEEAEKGEETPEEDDVFLLEDARAEPRVRAAAMLFQSLCYEYKDTLSAGLIVAGYDPVEGPQIYSIPLGGALMPMKCTAGGSGSAYISAFMDAHFHVNMTKEAAVDFVKKSVAHAISRDGSSGGMIRVIVVTKHGLEEECIKGNELPVAP